MLRKLAALESVEPLGRELMLEKLASVVFGDLIYAIAALQLRARVRPTRSCYATLARVCALK